jgi:predicted urease superfamily metal-dependent hydrolase
MTLINSFDCDGVITVGIYPGQSDIIITGRSFIEEPETKEMLQKRGINNRVYFNPLPFNQKTRVSSGEHKGNTIVRLYKEEDIEVKYHFEDDEIQKAKIEEIIAENGLNTKVILVMHDLTEKENVRHIDDF